LLRDGSRALQNSTDSGELRFSTLDLQVRALWAKSGDDTFCPEGHGLLTHLLDVAAVAEVLVERETCTSLDWVGREFGLARKQCARWLAALAGLHDYGKAIPGFQRKWEHGKCAVEAQGLKCSPERACKVSNHSLATAALLHGPLLRVSGVTPGWLRHAVQAISAHHGYHFRCSEVREGRPVCELPAWERARGMMLTIYWRVLFPEGVSRPVKDNLSLPAANWLAGLTSVADWIGSNVEWFPLGERCDSLYDYYVDARRRAERALEVIVWGKPPPLLSKEISERADTNYLIQKILKLEQVEARLLQKVGDRLLKTATGPSLLLVEAPMGEGKTELSFLAHLRLQSANEHRGLYIAMPTQATGNALFSRALVFLDSFAEKLTDIQLIHGGALMNEELIRLRQIDANDEDSLASSAWFLQRRRPLLSPYGVGTVDQALFSVLNVKHHFVRLWGLRNRVVVLDEVHAYDTYTSELIIEFVRTLRALGCSVVLMSATLSRARRDKLLEAWGIPLADITYLAYPRVVIADKAGVRGESFEARPLPDILLESVGESIELIAEQAAFLLGGDGCGAVIVNTVDRAQEIYKLLRAKLSLDVPILLFHARFPMDERAKRECEVLALFGAGANRPERALLIATQVAEQSLDIDFDFMLSDLAPIDLLLQRAGRLHRHERLRPAAYTCARLWVAGLNSEFPELKETKWEYVYDAYLLVRTWAILKKEKVLSFPIDIDRLVQSVYDGEPIEAEIINRIDQLFGTHLAHEARGRQAANNILINIDDETQAAYSNKPHGHDADEESGQRNATRLGEDSIVITPINANAQDCWTLEATDFQENEEIGDSLAKRLYARQIRLSRKDVVVHFREKGVPDSFAAHPLLRNIYPLPLIDRKYETETLRLRLDPELGLVYEKTKTQ